MSAENVPMLGAVVPAFEQFISRWERVASMIPRCEAFVRPGLEYASECYGRLQNNNSYLIAMRM